jgi:carbamoyltransferase
MIILGINAYHADSSACIFINGNLIAATEEERFKRIKHWAGFPIESILFCLKEANINLDEVDYICIGRDPYAKIFNKLLYLLRNIFTVHSLLFKRLSNSKNVFNFKNELLSISNLDIVTLNSKIKYIEHHRSHLASAFFASPFNESAILSIDGSGDFTTTMLAIGKGNRIKVIDSINFPVSIGLLYTSFTQYLGFYNYGDEYKVMGLAPYGKAIYVDEIMKIIKLTKNGLFDWDKTYFSKPNNIKLEYAENIPTVSILYTNKLINLLGPERKPNQELEQRHKDIAASIQKVTENIVLHILRNVQSRTGLTNICIAGGVAQNSVLNGKILNNTLFKNIYIPSAGHDAGICMGAALYMYNHNLNFARIEPIYSAYTGSHFTNEQIEEILIKRGLSFEKLDDDVLFEKIVDKLIEPGVIGWFSGSAEFGPRALGARSILADPRNPKAKDLLNEKIKRRESFRPFAPSILIEYVDEYFENVDMVPFMEKVFPIKPTKYNLIPAVTHVDGTGRLQTVSKEFNPRYYSLIEAFRKRTKIPILLNTSFNENEPIVDNPDQAIDCFLRTNMDMLVLENYIVIRNNF